MERKGGCKVYILRPDLQAVLLLRRVALVLRLFYA